MIRIGIDVGGTNTDAVLMRGRTVAHAVKAPTTEDVMSGVLAALEGVLERSGIDRREVDVVMIGTTHFTNAVVQRRDLAPTAAVRLGLPATACLPPMVDWPADLRAAIGGHTFLAHGGHEFDGREISPFDVDELRGVGRRIADLGIATVAISSVFSPVNTDMEERARDVLREELPEATFTLSSEIGRIGLLERENAAIMNACLQPLSRSTVQAFRTALGRAGLEAPFYLTQNDGTLMSADHAERYPVLTFASGPTNSMRGAAFLSGIRDAVVVDVGGTTTDVGALHNGFPREASVAVEVGGVRTNFRMPDVFSMGLGGGSLVHREPLDVGPTSVGYRLPQEGLVFGGSTLTATDVAVAAGRAAIGEPANVATLGSDFVAAVMAVVTSKVERAVERMLLSPEPIPVIVVGGGAILVGDHVGPLQVLRPDHAPVANAVGAAIAQISGEVDRVFSLAQLPREEAVAEAKREAVEKAVVAGADRDTTKIVDVDDVPLAYLPGNATRIRVKAVGDLHGV